MFHLKKLIDHPLIVLCVAVFALYGLNVWTPLFWDDEYFILKNVFIHRFDIVAIFTRNADAGAGVVSEYYRPISGVTYAINWMLHGSHPFGYHLVNNILHIVNGILVYHVAKKLVVPSAAVMVAGLFLVHPVQVNTIAYVSGRDSLLAGCAIFSSILLYEKHRYLSLLAFLVALFSRETAIVTPILILLVQYPHWRRYIMSLLPYGAMAGIYVFLRFSILQFGSTSNLSGIEIPLIDRVLTFLGVLAHYIILLFIPHNQHFRINPPRYDSFELPVIGGIVVCVALLAVCSYLFYSKHHFQKIWIIGLGWFFVNLSLSTGIIIPLHFSMQEHWLYLPMIGPSLIFAHYIGKLPYYKAGFGVVFLILFVLTGVRNVVWQSPIAVWEESIQYEKPSPQLLNNLGGRYQDMRNTSKAAHYYAQSVLAGSLVPEPYYNLAGILWSQKEYAKARDMFDRAIEKDSTFVRAYISAAGMEGEQGNWDNAEQYLLSAALVSTSPTDQDTIQKMLQQVQQFKRVYEASGNTTSK